MKSAFRLFILVAVALCAVSCYVQKEYLDEPQYSEQYLGLSYGDIIDLLGPPERTTSDGRGGTILIYEDVTTTSKGYMDSDGGRMTSKRDVQYLHLYVSDSDSCYRVRTRFTRPELNLGLTLSTVGLGALALLIPILAVGL